MKLYVRSDSRTERMKLVASYLVLARTVICESRVTRSRHGHRNIGTEGEASFPDNTPRLRDV